MLNTELICYHCNICESCSLHGGIFRLSSTRRLSGRFHPRLSSTLSRDSHIVSHARSAITYDPDRASTCRDHQVTTPMAVCSDRSTPRFATWMSLEMRTTRPRPGAACRAASSAEIVIVIFMQGLHGFQPFLTPKVLALEI